MMDLQEFGKSLTANLEKVIIEKKDALDLA